MAAQRTRVQLRSIGSWVQLKSSAFGQLLALASKSLKDSSLILCSISVSASKDNKASRTCVQSAMSASDARAQHETPRVDGAVRAASTGTSETTMHTLGNAVLSWNRLEAFVQRLAIQHLGFHCFLLLCQIAT